MGTTARPAAANPSPSVDHSLCEDAERAPRQRSECGGKQSGTLARTARIAHRAGAVCARRCSLQAARFNRGRELGCAHC